MASGAGPSLSDRCRPHLMATDLVHLPRSQHSQPPLPHRPRLHLQSWRDPFPPNGRFHFGRFQKQASFELQVLEHNRKCDWICHSSGNAHRVRERIGSASAASDFVRGPPRALLSAPVGPSGDGDVDVALAVTRVAGDPSGLRVVQAAAADERAEARCRARGRAVGVEHGERASLLLGAGSWGATHESCLVCWLHCFRL